MRISGQSCFKFVQVPKSQDIRATTFATTQGLVQDPL